MERPEGHLTVDDRDPRHAGLTVLRFLRDTLDRVLRELEAGLTRTSMPRMTPRGSGADDWLTLEEGARILKMHPASLRRAIKRGSCKAVKLNNARVFRLRREWLDEYMTGRTIGRES